jgi:twitching motility protein PilT
MSIERPTAMQTDAGMANNNASMSAPTAVPIPGAVPQPSNGQGANGPVSPPPMSQGPVSAPSAGNLGVRRETARKEEINLDKLLTYMVKANGSDLHLTVGSPPFIRINGDIKTIPNHPVIEDEPLEEALMGVLTPHQKTKFNDELELDFAHTVEGIARFRGNLFKQRGNYGAVFRVIPWEIKPLEALGMPNAINNFAALPRGLVLITGPTGSGKSTTLAALVDKSNRTRSGHIMTIEDPIEFIHQNRGCVINQREVGEDTHSFNSALKHVLRQDPDIILIGELRDLETISIALTAAETGHLVYATLHTQSAQDTINRVIDVFPPSQQAQIRAQMAATLRGVVCQTLVQSKDGKGRVPAAEVMVVNPAIATMIRKGDTHLIPQALQSGGQLGMQTLNQNLATLVAQNIITRSDAEEVSTDLKDLDALISGATANARGAGGQTQTNLNMGSGKF